MITNKPIFTHQDYEITDRQVIYEGIFRYVHYYLRHRLFKEGWTPVFKREVVERTHAAGILLYDPLLDKVVLIYQFRPGAMITETMKSSTEHAPSPWVIEVVAGVFDTAEQPEALAAREAQEEAGCAVLDLCPVSQFFVSPGSSNEYMHLYCGRIDASQVGGIHGLKEENEDIYAFSLLAEEAFEWLRQGKITTVPAIIALQWLQMNRETLRARWTK